jgi:hypothetical protein
MSTTGTVPQKKWYEDDVVVTDKDEERQTQFSRAGVGFDAIQVKLQQLYEVGVLKLFIESEILKSNTGAFEPGFKELYSPYSMTIPQRTGKDLLFTSDVEFSDSGFASGSLENDKKKIFLNRTEFNNYLLRLPKPISDIGTPLNEKQDMNAYKYLQILGNELQDKILFLCDSFIQGYNQQYAQNTNDISRIQKEVTDLKRLFTGPDTTAQKRILDKENQLVQLKNVKIKLETKRANYKNACAILSNATRRSQYNASLVAAYPALKNDASSYSTAIVDWFKYKQNGSNFFKDVCKMFTPMIPKEMLTVKQDILIAVQEVIAKLATAFKPIFESYFFNELTANIARYTRMVPNNTYASYLFELSNPVNRRNDPSKFSWININAVFSKIIKETPFANHFDKVELERLQTIVKLMANFNSEIVTLFSLFKFEKNLNIFNGDPKNVFERAEQDDDGDFFKRADNVNALFQNVFYLKQILEIFLGGLAGLGGGQTQLVTDFQNKITDVVEKIVNVLLPKLDGYRIKAQRYDYDTLLGAGSHSGFVENAFSGKITFISHFHKNNKFLVSSEFIQNSPVTITIPDGNYTTDTLSTAIENALCGSCKWARKSSYDAEMLWRCKYDNKNVLQLRLYFPVVNMFKPGPPPNIPNVSSNYQFAISSATNMGGMGNVSLKIPRGEYKNINQVLAAMQIRINEFMSQQSVPPFQSALTITLERNPNPAINVPCIKFKLKKKSPRDPREDLNIELLAPEVSELFVQSNAVVRIQLVNDADNAAWLPQNNPNPNSEKMLQAPPRELHLSNTITIVTSTRIDGEVYDASDIFGITRLNRQQQQRNHGDGINSLQLFPDIIMNKLHVSDTYDARSSCGNRINNVDFQPCIFLDIILNAHFNLTLSGLIDFGILNFTSKRINDEFVFKPVDMKEIEKGANASASGNDATRNVFKTEILAKTGVYMNRRLVNAKVPVITPVDILNSILYRYPCLPPVKRGLIEGSTQFDEFIGQRVNVADFNAIVCLGKGEKGQTPSTTFKKVLEKTLMYDEGDGRRNKLLCDLHYAICGPVYSDINPSQEINRLTMMDQFTLQDNRPNVILPGTPTPVNIRNNLPFKVKGITPFYDYDKEYYKYLIYGECDEASYTYGCIKYYDPGEKLGPGHTFNASELYSIILVLSFQTDALGNTIGASSTIHNVLWHSRDQGQSHEYDKFIIIGEFQSIMFRNKYETDPATNPPIEYTRIPPNATNSGSYAIWKLPHANVVRPGGPSYFEFDPISNCIRNMDFATARIRVSNMLQVVTPDYDQIRFVILANNSQGETMIFLPFAQISGGNWNPNPIVIDVVANSNPGQPPVVIPHKISCSAISVNKSLQNANNRINFYTVMRNKNATNPNPNPTLQGYATQELAEYANQLNGLNAMNPSIQNNLLWLGLEKRTQKRKILSCMILDVTTGQETELDLPIDFEDGDSIENIRVDINNPEIVTVFGRFKATVSDTGPSERPNKAIYNAMVIYTNLQNAAQNDRTYGSPAYSFEYDNFKGTTVNDDPEFKSFYSCMDGLVPASSVDKGTTQQNIGILTVKKTQASEISIIGFHNAKLTAAVSEKSTVKDGANASSLLCYDYNMCADNLKLAYDEFLLPPVPPETKKEYGVFNPVTFYAFYVENANASLSKGVYALIHAKNPTQLFSTPSKLHVLNTWGIDLSSNQTLFYKRLYEPTKNSTVLKFNVKGYEKYMNDIVDTILSSAKAYYEEKIKSTFYEYGTIDGNPPILFKRDADSRQNVIVGGGGGGKEEDAKQMLRATEYVNDSETAKKDKKDRKNVTFKKIIEIRIPDIMMSDEYVSAITEPDRKNARMIFVNSIFKYSRQLYDIVAKQNEDVTKNRGADNNVVILDEYQIVLCSKNETIQNRFNEIKAMDQSSTSFLTLSDDVFGFELTYSSSQTQQQQQQPDKNIILVNEWNDRGFIGDYGAYAYSDADASSSLTLNQRMISKSQQIMTESTPSKEAVTRVVPKYPNTAFLLNPIFSYHTLDPSRWTGVQSLFDGDNSVTNLQSGGARPPLYSGSSYGSFGLQDPYMYSQPQPQPQAFGSYGAAPYGYGGYGYGQQPGIRPQGYGYGYGYGYGDNGDEVVKMKRKVLELSDVPSKNMKKISFQTMQTDTRFKKIVLWLFDSRENKMLMTKTFIGNNKVVLSLPVQNQQVGAIRASGYSLLQQLCRRLFNQADIIRKWTLEVSYAYEDDVGNRGSNGITGIFIYSAKSFDLPKPTLELIYVNMQAVLNLTKGAIIIKKGMNETGGEKENGSQLEINARDVALIGEVFRVVPLIQGGIISPTSKEFNEIVASLVSKTPHQHLRSSISEKKRRENVEANINFLVNLFFPQNSLFFVRGQLKYYIYSTQRSCKIFTIVKQPGYDDDSYLTCLKLFLQSEYDYKQKLNTFRVGCSMKKKLIADNFSSVWDSFWNDLIESQEQASSTKQIENDIGSAELGQGQGQGEGQGQEGDEGQLGSSEVERQAIKASSKTAPVCLNGALTTCKRMYDVREDWKLSSYYPLAYDGVLYNTEQQYGGNRGNSSDGGFNNEYYYNLDPAKYLQTDQAGNTFYGFKCMKYNGDNANPVLYLGGTLRDDARNTLMSAVYEVKLKDKTIKPILTAMNENSEILCIDIIGKYLLIGGKGFDRVSTFQNDAVSNTSVPLVLMNTETYVVTAVYDENANVTPPRIHLPNDNTKINKVCICKKRRIINKKDANAHYEYVALFGGNIQIETAGAGFPHNIENVGCLVIKIPIDESNPNFKLVARMYCIDRFVENSNGQTLNGRVLTNTLGLKLVNLPQEQTVKVDSIICDEEGQGEQEQEGQGEAAVKNKTTFYVGGYFNAFTYMDYSGFQDAEAATTSASGVRVDPNAFIKSGQCNSILKLTITSSYNTAASDYRQQCVFEPIETNANKNNVVFNASLALNRGGVASKNYLLAFTAFFNSTTNPFAMDDTPVSTSLNVFDLKTKVNTQVMVAVPRSRIDAQLQAVVKQLYKYQCIIVIQDVQSKKSVAVMNYTILDPNDANDHYAYSFTCALNDAEDQFRVVESKSNDEAITSHYDSIADMCNIENETGDQADIYVAHENITKQNSVVDQILYPLTVKSNYQQVGNWNMATITMTTATTATAIAGGDQDVSNEGEIETFFRFATSLAELSKIFKKYPSMMLFLQNIDYRDKNEKITKNVLQKMYIDLETKTSLDDPANSIRDPKVIEMDYSCNDIFYKLTYMLQFWYIATNADSNFNDNSNQNLFNLIKNFYDYFIFLLIYAGCIRLAQTLCDNYVDLVLSSANDRNGSADVLAQDNWKEKFMTTFESIASSNTFKSFFNQMASSYDRTFTNIMICSNPETYTGVAYVARQLDTNLSMIISSETKQKMLHHKIYKSNEKFFNENDTFFTTLLASDAINTVDQINFCSFYKFQRRQMDGNPFRTNFGGMMDETVYVSISAVSNAKIEVVKMFEFLKIIITYFKGLPSGAPIVDTGISGPIKRIIFGGDFGCNLLHDSEVCSQFAKNGMKIYTMPNNSNAFIDNTNVSGNQMFIVDASLLSSSSSSSQSSSSSLQVGGAGKQNENKNIVTRLTIGEPLKNDDSQTMKLIIINHKKKTRRRYK